ncbi:ankyrin-1-like [Mytilus trossulus]|uniref:ankyrin-1-like n=1 Tax=Mytilus trossulus TaxID=6551 RepID=UPI003007122B
MAFIEFAIYAGKTKEVKSSKNKDLTDRESTFPLTTDSEKINEIRPPVYTLVTLLLSAGADINFVSKDGESPLYMLLKLHDTGLVNVILQLFIEKGADPNKGIAVPIILAAELNRQKAMKMLLDAGAMVDKLNQHGETALITSLRAFSKSLEVKNIGTVKLLLESGASFYLKDKDGNIPLSLPFMSEKHALDLNPKRDAIIMKMLSTLLEKGTCPNTQPDGEDTSLMLAADNCLPECVKLLLEFGAHSYHIGRDGLTALHKCISATGFLPCRTSRYRTTGLHNSISGAMLEIEKFVNLEDKKKTEKNRLKILELLLLHRAPVNIDKEGHDSPLLLAIQYEDIESIKALLKAGSNLSHRGVDRLNAFERCLKSGYSGGLTIFDILLEHQTPEKDSIDSLFHLLWEYVKDREKFRKPLLEGICVKLLSTDIEIAVDLGKPDEDSPLIYFCRLQCLEVVRMLLARKADVNHIGSDGKTVLHTLIDMTGKDSSDFQQMVEIIFSAKPNFDTKDECDKSPIEESAYKYIQQHCHYHLDLTNIGVLVQHLLYVGASLPSSELDKLLKKAAEIGDFTTMESVCRHGANKYMTDENENMILHICWSKKLDGALQFLEYYKEEGGFFNKVNKDGDLPLFLLLNEHIKQRDKSEKLETQTANIAAYLMKNTTTEVLDKDGNSPLHVAAKAGLVKIIEALILCGATSCKQNKKGRTALHVCLEKPKSNIAEVVSKLMDSENPPVELEVSGRTPLFLATNLYERYYMHDYNCTKEMMTLQSRVVEVLIQHGANPNSHNRSYIPLLSAVKAGDIDTVSLLLEKGALADITNEKGQSAIHVLFSEMPHISRDAEMILLQLLIDNGISVNATDDEGKSALIVAVERYGDRNRNRNRILSRKSNPSFTNNIINELLRHGADVKAVDKRGRTALNIFCQKGSTMEIGRNLLQAGADPSVGNCLQSVLHNSELCKKTELFLELLHKGANPNIYSRDGSNLIDVTKKGTTQLVEELLRYGAEVNVVDYGRKSALHYACACDIETQKERNDIIRLLISHGAKLNLISSEFRRPLDCFIYRMITDIRELEILHDEVPSHQHLKIDLSSFNHLVRCGCVLAPIEDIVTTYFHDEYRMGMVPDFPDEISSLLFLIKNGMLTAATFLIRCGWEIEIEEWIDSFDISKLNVSTVQLKYGRCNRINMEKPKADFGNFLKTFRKSTRSLSMLCINSIRKQMLFASGGSEIETKIEALQVPEKIKSFINLTEFMQDEEIIMLEETARAPPRNRLGFGAMSSMMDSNTFDSASYDYSASTYPYNDDDLSFEDMIDQQLNLM